MWTSIIGGVIQIAVIIIKALSKEGELRDLRLRRFIEFADAWDNTAVDSVLIKAEYSAMRAEIEGRRRARTQS